MAKNKFYGVRKGREVGIFDSWEKTKKIVQGYSGAEYASFPTKKLAFNYVNSFSETKGDILEGEGKKEKKTEIKNFDFEVYTDGSFKDGTYSYAYVFVQDGQITPMEDSGVGNSDNEDLNKLANVAGEMKAVIEAVRTAVELETKILIRHDYEGVAYWIIDDPKYGHPWKARNEFTKKYVKFMNKYRKYFEFKHIKGHSNDEFNDYVDRLAKQELGIEVRSK